MSALSEFFDMEDKKKAQVELDQLRHQVAALEKQRDEWIRRHNLVAKENNLLHLRVSEVVAQRDEVLKSMIEARQAIQFANDSPGGGISDTIWMMHRPETLFDFMDAAIANAKGAAA